MNDEIKRLIALLTLADFQLWLLRKREGRLLQGMLELVEEFSKEVK